jgi:hypothetical protein
MGSWRDTIDHTYSTAGWLPQRRRKRFMILESINCNLTFYCVSRGPIQIAGELFKEEDFRKLKLFAEQEDFSRKWVSGFEYSLAQANPLLNAAPAMSPKFLAALS